MANQGAYWDRSSWVSFHGSYSARSYQGSESGHKADEWLITPPIELPDNSDAIVSFYGVTNQDPEESNGSISIYVLNALYDNAEDLAQNALFISTKDMNRTWQYFTTDLQGHSGTVYLAFRYNVPFSNGKFNWVFIDDIKVRIPGQAKFTVVDQATGQPVQGAYVNLLPEGTEGFYGKTDSQGEAIINLDDYISYNYTVRAAGYLPQTGTITLQGEVLSINEELHDRIVTPVDLTIQTQQLEPGEALLSGRIANMANSGMTRVKPMGSLVLQMLPTTRYWVLPIAMMHDWMEYLGS
jgi:hypothetical protein